jgi:hypothetical protein
MGQLSFATETPGITVSRTDNVLPFHASRSSRNGLARVTQSGLSGGVVVSLPLASRESRRGASRTEVSIGDSPTEPLGGKETRFTSFDFIATALLILSVFAAPALIWSLLRSASFG